MSIASLYPNHIFNADEVLNNCSIENLRNLMKNYFASFMILITFFITDCTVDNTVAQKPSIGIPDTIDSEHFTFVLYDGLSQNITTQILKKLEENYARVLGDLNLTSMNKVTVKIWNDETHFLDDMQRDIGTRYTGATGYVYSPYDIRFLYRGINSQTALHEFCHAVSLVVNSRFGNNPRWFWEAVAIYESGELTNPKSISYLVNGNFPTLAELNSGYNTGNYKIYEVGYLLSEYIINRWGKSSFVDLIKSSGNLQLTLGVTPQIFEVGWKQFVENKYLK